MCQHSRRRLRLRRKPLTPSACGGVCLADNDGDGLCDVDQGCTYSDAANYNDQATVDDGSCEWNNTCPADLNGDGFIQLNDLLDLLGDYNSACP